VANLDSRLKRSSMQMYAMAGTLPLIDGTVGATDRAHVAGFYAGLTYSAVAALVLALLDYMPRAQSAEVAAFIVQNAQPTGRGIDWDLRAALANTLSISLADALKISVDDMWKRYKAANNL
jgi:hypothetical protein